MRARVAEVGRKGGERESAEEGGKAGGCEVEDIAGPPSSGREPGKGCVV